MNQAKRMEKRLIFDVFGTMMRVEYRQEQWLLYRMTADGKSSRIWDVAIPAELTEPELASFLDDMFHEYASAENPLVRQLDD